LLSGYYVINAFSGKVLGNPGSSRSHGTGIIQWNWNGGKNQQWGQST
jgi:hypothetical protein